MGWADEDENENGNGDGNGDGSGQLRALKSVVEGGRVVWEGNCLPHGGFANKFVVVRSLNLARNRAICIIRIRRRFCLMNCAQLAKKFSRFSRLRVGEGG